MTRDRKYARVYYDDLEREFPDVWRDPVLRGDYLLLLVAAERAWPSSPEIPRLCRPRSPGRLAEAGLIFLEPPYHYRARGLDKERDARRKGAAHAASARWSDSDKPPPGNAPRNADGNASASDDAMPKRERDEQEKETSREGDPALDAYQRFFTYPSRRALKFLDSLSDEFGAERVARAIGSAGLQGTDELLSRTRGLLVLEDRDAERREKADEQARLAAKRAPLPPLRIAKSDLSDAEIEAEVAAYRASQNGAA